MDGAGTGSYIDHIILRERDTDNDDILDEFHYYCQNWRADVVAIVDEAGRQVEQVRYTPYGTPITIPFAEQAADGALNFNDYTAYLANFNSTGYEVLADRNLDGSRNFNDLVGFQADFNAAPVVGRGVLSNYGHRFGYGGYWYVAERGLYHVRNRWYDPENGTWLTRDPLGYVDGGSRYAYARSHPTTFLDPSGLVRIEVRYKKVFGIFNHAYIIVTDENGKQYVFRGGPEVQDSKDAASRSSRASSGEGDGSGAFGDVEAVTEEYVDDDSPDWDDDYDGPVDVVRDDDQPAQPFIDRLTEACRKLNELDVPYDPNGPNSNSTVRELLEESGENPPDKRPWTRGWKKNIKGIGND